MSFAFRLLFAILYFPMGIVTVIILLITLLLSYYIILTFLLNLKTSPFKRVGLIISSFIYPIGIFTLHKTINDTKTQIDG